jgi:hypothetical protein
MPRGSFVSGQRGRGGDFSKGFIDIKCEKNRAEKTAPVLLKNIFKLINYPGIEKPNCQVAVRLSCQSYCLPKWQK